MYTTIVAELLGLTHRFANRERSRVHPQIIGVSLAPRVIVLGGYVIDVNGASKHRVWYIVNTFKQSFQFSQPMVLFSMLQLPVAVSVRTVDHPVAYDMLSWESVSFFSHFICPP